jgi:hypothetical protein
MDEDNDEGREGMEGSGGNRRTFCDAGVDGGPGDECDGWAGGAASDECDESNEFSSRDEATEPAEPDRLIEGHDLEDGTESDEVEGGPDRVARHHVLGSSFESAVSESR